MVETECYVTCEHNYLGFMTLWQREMVVVRWTTEDLTSTPTQRRHQPCHGIQREDLQFQGEIQDHVTFESKARISQYFVNSVAIKKVKSSKFQFPSEGKRKE